ncbi:uncharacterized protein LOC123878560 [Maniola jurtina]|uniref:uncharacterized protein LOC123878560 n=1 Tax=Maniola jurtina TaxID=191418 RepID=UPI001E68B3C5|nr:uncharacterized protein LOC123878560 [Maniola jurtina]
MSKALEGKNLNIYAECENIKRSKPDVRVTEEIAREIGRNYRTLPAFEKGLFDYIYTKHYSLDTNELLRCRWRQYKKHIERRVIAPCQFPCNRDLHFYNGCIRFMPSESIYRLAEHRMKLRPGPGVDFRGQVPIPQELLMRRGNADKQDGAKVPTSKKENKIKKI